MRREEPGRCVRRLLQRFDRLILLSLSHVHAGQVVVALRVLRIRSDRPHIGVHSPLRVILVVVGHPQIVVRCRVGPIKLHGLLVRVDGLVQHPLAMIRQTEVVVRLLISGIVLEGSFVPPYRLVEALARDERVARLVVRNRIRLPAVEDVHLARVAPALRIRAPRAHQDVLHPISVHIRGVDAESQLVLRVVAQDLEIRGHLLQIQQLRQVIPSVHHVHRTRAPSILRRRVDRAHQDILHPIPVHVLTRVVVGQSIVRPCAVDHEVSRRILDHDLVRKIASAVVHMHLPRVDPALGVTGVHVRQDVPDAVSVHVPGADREPRQIVRPRPGKLYISVSYLKIDHVVRLEVPTPVRHEDVPGTAGRCRDIALTSL